MSTYVQEWFDNCVGSAKKTASTLYCRDEPNLLQNLPILLFRTAFKNYLFCSQTAPILLGIMLGVARQVFNYIQE